MKTFNQFICEARTIVEGNKLGRALHKIETRTTGQLSADRGSSESTNREARKALEQKLKKRFGGFSKTVGKYSYKDPGEDEEQTSREVSYGITKPNKMSNRRFGKLMRRTGREAGQESVITKKPGKQAKLFGTGSDKSVFDIGKHARVGPNPTREGETIARSVRGAKLPKGSDSPTKTFHYSNEPPNRSR